MVSQGQEKATAIAQQLPASYVVKQDIGGVPQDVRRLTVSVYERFVENAIGRGLLGRGDRDNPWTVVSALFANLRLAIGLLWMMREPIEVILSPFDDIPNMILLLRAADELKIPFVASGGWPMPAALWRRWRWALPA
jgi:hypothetical protein